MDLQTAIERAKRLLEVRIERNQNVHLPEARKHGTGSHVDIFEQHIRLDTDALQTLREWKPEEKAQSTTASNADPLLDCCQHGVPLDNPCFDCDDHPIPAIPDSAPTGEGREE